MLRIVSRKCIALVIVVTAAIALAGCGGGTPTATEPAGAQESGSVTLLPGDDRFGIYSLDLVTQEVEEIYSSPNEIFVL